MSMKAGSRTMSGMLELLRLRIAGRFMGPYVKQDHFFESRYLSAGHVSNITCSPMLTRYISWE